MLASVCPSINVYLLDSQGHRQDRTRKGFPLRRLVCLLTWCTPQVTLQHLPSSQHLLSYGGKTGEVTPSP